MKTMKDYYNLQLKWNVLLSADVFEKFSPCHYLSAPALSWDVMLNA